MTWVLSPAFALATFTDWFLPALVFAAAFEGIAWWWAIRDRRRESLVMFEVKEMLIALCEENPAVRQKLVERLAQRGRK